MSIWNVMKGEIFLEENNEENTYIHYFNMQVIGRESIIFVFPQSFHNRESEKTAILYKNNRIGTTLLVDIISSFPSTASTSSQDFNIVQVLMKIERYCRFYSLGSISYFKLLGIRITSLKDLSHLEKVSTIFSFHREKDF